MNHNTFLMRNYPKTKRNIEDRLSNITEADREKARKFDKDFFDGDRRYGYGGYKYDGRWIPVVKDFIDYFNLNKNSSILDIEEMTPFYRKVSGNDSAILLSII